MSRRCSLVALAVTLVVVGCSNTADVEPVPSQSTPGATPTGDVTDSEVITKPTLERVADVTYLAQVGGASTAREYEATFSVDDNGCLFVESAELPSIKVPILNPRFTVDADGILEGESRVAEYGTRVSVGVAAAGEVPSEFSEQCGDYTASEAAVFTLLEK